MGRDYFLGLDMGTGSLGWAVTDSEYKILKKYGKALWGVRLFDSASTAEERRVFRTNRRRLDRRNWRIQILQELFAEEIVKVDPGFFLRMKESKYYPEEKRDMDGKCPELPYSLFVDKDYTDKDFYKEFPTIYHLRKWLMETEKTPDIRLVYLAIHHMMKHRGHFLLSGDISQIKEFSSTFTTLVQNLRNEELEWTLEINEEKLSEIEEILKDKNITRSTRKTRLVKISGAKSACEKGIITLITGGTAKLSDIFGNTELNESERPKISFADSGYDDYIGVVADTLGEQFYIIESAKAVYDWAILVDILGDSSSISEAKVKIFKKHKNDLAYLKSAAKKYLTKQEYNKIFVDNEEKLHNYCAYIGMAKKNGRKVSLEAKRCCSQSEFYDFLRKNVLPCLSGQKIKEYLENEIEHETFLPKQVSKENSVIPYQVHLFELRKILKNMENKIPFIAQNTEKIIQLFEFKIPYYVGPLNGNKVGTGGNFSWAVRQKCGKIYPWNFNEIIDTEASAEAFIRRMTNKCTYLIGEDVLPKDSLLYSKYMVLNELNNLKLNGNAISVELKQRIYTDVFCRYRKVTIKKLKNYLVTQGLTDRNVDITGIDGDFKATLTSYHDFKEKLTGVNLTLKEKEEIILNIVLFGDDKKLLKQRLSKRFPELSAGQMKAICTLSYKAWGRLSKNFLEEIAIPAPETGEVWNIITALWETNDNLMQLLGRKYKFMEAVEEFNSDKKSDSLNYETIQDLYVSPAVKRQIWQTLQVVKELRNVMGTEPNRVFVEMAREKAENKRTISRKKQLQELYKSCQKDEKELISELNNAEEQTLRSDKLYLYYTQKGRCMYSGETIDLDELWDNTKYDIDHIYPQSKTMDDSLNNRVLVKKVENEIKSDNYPIAPAIRKKMQSFWKSLLEGGFISEEKYKRLTRNETFDENELAGFIERQIVETRQATKIVADILKRAFPDSEIVYVKAGTVSRFRQEFDLIKAREINDLHHAKDAYLNIVVGNSYYVKFTKNAAWYVKNNPGRTYNLERMFTSKYDITRNGETAWKAGCQGTIVTVRKIMQKNNILVTRRSYEAKGGLFDQMILKKGKGQIPIKGSDERLSNIEKYGGYNKATGAYFMLVKSSDKKGKDIRTLEYVPLYLKAEIEKSEEDAKKYLIKEKGLKEPEILIRKIKTDTLFEVDGFKMWLTGRKGTQVTFAGANQLILSLSETKCMKKVLKYVQRRRENKNLILYESDGIAESELVNLYDCFLYKLQNTIYNKKLSLQVKTLSEKKENFVGLSKEEKCVVLSEILHMFQCQSVNANLSLIGGPANAGSLAINSNITDCKNIFIINQSPTGMFEKKIDLQKL